MVINIRNLKDESRYFLNKLKGKKNPIVFVIGCIHGDELVGEKIIKKLNNIKIKNGTLITLLGNKKALNLKKRYISQDLNRSFPGKANGNYEEKLAHNILKIARRADFTIDIHSTTADTESLVIITKKNKKILSLINTFKPKNVALMKKSIGNRAFTYYCKAGISMEYGKDKDMGAAKNILNDILIMLKSFDMIKNLTVIKNKKNKTKFYKITGVVKKEHGFITDNKIKNFKLVEEGDIIAKNDIKIIKAKNSFYPILFGEKAYKDIIGFSAVRVNNL